MEIKYYKAGIAIRSLQAKAYKTGSGNAGTVNVIAWKDTAGVESTKLKFTSSSVTEMLEVVKNIQLYNASAIYASSDSNFDVDEYSAQNTVGSLTFNAAEGITGKTFRISVNNNSQNDITVNSFKFEKNNICYHNGSENKVVSALVFWVKLDSPVTIAPGITKDFVIDINFQNE